MTTSQQAAQNAGNQNAVLTPTAPNVQVPDNLTNYTFDQLEQAWINAGGDPAWAPTMAAIAWLESGGTQEWQIGYSGPPGGACVWQITPGAENLNQSISACAAAAVADFNSQGVGAWDDPAGYLAKDQGGPLSWSQIQSLVPSGFLSGATDLSGEQGTTTSNASTSSIFSLPGSFSTFFNDVTSAGWWKRIGIGGLGIALIIGGTLLFISQTKTGQEIKSEAPEAAAAALA